MLEATVTLATVLLLVVVVVRKIAKRIEHRSQEIANEGSRSTPAAKAQAGRDKKARQDTIFWAGF